MVPVLAGCGDSGGSPVSRLLLRPGEHIASIPAHDPLEQAVAVVFLMPETTLAVDVITGRLFAPEKEQPFPFPSLGEHEGLIALVDPQLHNQIFAYEDGGIPGQPAWDRRWGKSPAPAPGPLPAWTPPRLVMTSGRPVAVVLADGQHVDLATDAAGRIVRLRWATPRGEPLLTKISYARAQTTVSAPAGVVRTYHYNARDLITRVDASGAAAHASEDTADGRLDSRATKNLLADRLRPGTPERYAAYGVAPNAIAEDKLGDANTDAYQRYGVPTVADMRRVNASLRASGVLDVAEAIPILNNRVENYTAEKPFERLTEGLTPCRFEVGYYDITYDRRITPAEIATVARRLRQMPKRWVYIYYNDANSIGCAEQLLKRS
jgi:hypothetical protein